MIPGPLPLHLMHSLSLHAMHSLSLHEMHSLSLHSMHSLSLHAMHSLMLLLTTDAALPAMNLPPFGVVHSALATLKEAIVLFLAAVLALSAAALHLLEERGRVRAVARLAALAPLAWMLTVAPAHLMMWPALTIGLVVAILARERDDLLHSECALKLLWVMGSAIALSWAGVELLSLVTGTATPAEQWAVLSLGLGERFLWSTALPLSLLVGFVMLAAPPFHFWAADLFHGARPWLAPLAVASLQVAGVAWIARRLEGIEAFPAAAANAGDLLSIAALSAFLVGGATMVAQRHPERRVGGLASLNGALVLAILSTSGRGAEPALKLVGGGVWAAHLVLALTGAATLARLVPVSTARAEAGPVLFRRHPWSGAVGLYSLASLAGVPGTPGAFLWIGVARQLLASGRTELLLALAFAWVAAFSAAVKQAHESYGIRVPFTVPATPVPALVRATLWIAGLALAVIGIFGLE